MAILGFGRRFLSFKHKLLGFSNELVLPFYILHQTIIVAIAFFVVSLNLIAIGKYLIIILASFSIVGILLLPIRQFNVLRFLFGMKFKKRKRQGNIRARGKMEEWDETINTPGELEEATQLIEAGFEYVTEMDGHKLFRKRK